MLNFFFRIVQFCIYIQLLHFKSISIHYMVLKTLALFDAEQLE